jgi:adenylylsulfate kinase-like enzyme
MVTFKRILVFGLPGSGKTTFSKKLLLPNMDYYNADEIRKKFNDWDFSIAGRKLQSVRMLSMTVDSKMNKRHSIADFVAPFDKKRQSYDIKIWMNTISESKYRDTNEIFEKPKTCNFEIKDYNYENIIKEIHNEIKKK